MKVGRGKGLMQDIEEIVLFMRRDGRIETFQTIKSKAEDRNLIKPNN